MLNAEIIKYQTNIKEQEIKDFFHIENKSPLDLIKLIETINFLEIKISRLLNFIISKATIKIILQKNISLDFVKQDKYNFLLGPFTDNFEKKENILKYEAGNDILNKDLALIVLLITYDFLNKGNIFIKDLKNILNNLRLNSFIFKYNFQIMEYNEENKIISDEDLSQCFNELIYKKHSNLIKFIRDSVEIFYQNHVISRMIRGFICEISVNSNNSNPELFIIELIKQGKIPGPLIEILNIQTKNNFKIVRFKIGGESDKNLNNNLEDRIILKNLIISIFYEKSIQILENLMRENE